MAEGIFIERDGFRTMLKWHRARKLAGDVAFTQARILEAMRLGASIEIDLKRHADGGFAVIHDDTLDRETTGTGPVADALPDTLRTLRLRDDAGLATEHPLLLVTDLGALVADSVPHPQALLQLDLKEDASAITLADVEAFAGAMAPVMTSCILSGHDERAVRMLAETAPGMKVGYDPCEDHVLAETLSSGDFSGFVSRAVAAMPEASTIYLEHGFVLEVDRRGFDLIDAFHGHGKIIDCWTVAQADEQTKPLVARLLALQCDQITTDQPVALEALMN